MVPAKFPLAVIAIILFSHTTKAQSCGNCDETPRITQFDFDVRVPQPNVANATDQLWPEWKNLFLIASSVGSNLKKSEGNCIRLMIPPAIDTGDAQIGKISGETFTNLPSNPLIAADLSTYGEYLLTGTITADGVSCNVHAEIQTSCSRKVVVSADVNFQLSSVVSNVNNIAQQIAAQLSPISQKIKEFELEERNNNPALSLFQMSSGEPITIKTQKKSLKAGETTSFTLEVKDCDGVALAGREIIFTEDSINGMKISGTIGGTVSPARVVTDANGKATANFTLKTGARNAIIAAHSPGLEVKGCNSMLVGDAAINIRYNYSGHIQYSIEIAETCSEEKNSICNRSVFRSEAVEIIKYTASFYSTTQKGSGSVALSGSDEKETAGTDIPELLEGGAYSRKRSSFSDQAVTCESVQKGMHTTHTSKSHITGELTTGQINFSIPEKGVIATLFLDLNFNTVENYISTMTLNPTTNGSEKGKHTHSAIFIGDPKTDKNITYKKQIVNGKVTFTISGSRALNLGCPPGVTETIKCVIVQE